MGDTIMLVNTVFERRDFFVETHAGVTKNKEISILANSNAININNNKIIYKNNDVLAHSVSSAWRLSPGEKHRDALRAA